MEEAAELGNYPPLVRGKVVPHCLFFGCTTREQLLKER